MKKTRIPLWLGVGLLCALLSTAGRAELSFQEQYANIPYFPKEKLPVKNVALNAVNVKLGVHLERLTLISGEGNMDKKITAGLLAGAMTLLGGVGGGDFAEKEPLEEHLSSADAQHIADEIGTILTQAVQQSGLELVPPETITTAPGYAGVEGESKLTTDTENIKGNLFKPSYFFGYQQVPVLGYKFRKKPSFLFGTPSDNAATRVREIAGTPLTLSWSVSVVNDRKVMRVRELALIFWGQGAGSMSGADDKPWASIALEPDSLNVATGESHKNLEYWSALAPGFTEAAKTMAKRIAEKFAATAG